MTEPTNNPEANTEANPKESNQQGSGKKRIVGTLVLIIVGAALAYGLVQLLAPSEPETASNDSFELSVKDHDSDAQDDATDFDIDDDDWMLEENTDDDVDDFANDDELEAESISEPAFADDKAADDEAADDEVADNETADDKVADGEASASDADAQNTAETQHTESAAAAEAQSQDKAQDKQPEQSSEQKATQDSVAFDHGWTVQVASFSKPANADKLVDELKAQDFDARVANVLVDGKTWHRVYVGASEDKSQAQSLAEQLEKAGVESVLVRKISQ